MNSFLNKTVPTLQAFPALGMMLAGMMWAALPVNAQTSDPINLLATVDNTTVTKPVPQSGSDETSGSAQEISSIDEAIDSIESAAGDDATPNNTAADTAAGTVTQAITNEVGENTGTNAAADAGTDSGVFLVRKSAPVSSVADIGIVKVDSPQSSLTQTIWRGTPVDRALFLLNNGLNSEETAGPSRAIADLAHSVVAHRAVPPEGASDSAELLVNVRLAWLAAAGRSEDLAGLIDQLPNDDVWLDWKKWLVETQLMARRDDEACRNVKYQVSRTLEPFWHKSKVICSAAQGDSAGAQFGVDILMASGVNDPVFTALVGKLLNDSEVGPIDPALLDPLHIVLMDAAHHPIDIDGLNALSSGSIQTAVGLRYLDADARMVSTYAALQHGLIDHQKAAKLWRSVAIAADKSNDAESTSADLALARHQSMPTPLTRALVWRALDGEKSAARLALIAAALDVDIADGAGLIMAPLYADLTREALALEGADEVLAADETGLSARLGLMLAAVNDGEMPDVLAGETSLAAAALMQNLDAGGIDDAGDVANLETLNMWQLLPLVERTASPEAKLGTSGINSQWLQTASLASMEPASFLSVSPIMLRALEAAANENRVGEAALLAQRVIADIDLAMLHPADANRIAIALASIGQDDTASRFKSEVVSMHLLAAAMSYIPDLSVQNPIIQQVQQVQQAEEAPAVQEPQDEQNLQIEQNLQGEQGVIAKDEGAGEEVPVAAEDPILPAAEDSTKLANDQ
jgi:hypothetical protein